MNVFYPAEAETTAAKAKERERLLREDNTSLAETLAEERSRGEEREERSRALEQELREARDTIHTLTCDLDRWERNRGGGKFLFYFINILFLYLCIIPSEQKNNGARTDPGRK